MRAGSDRRWAASAATTPSSSSTPRQPEVRRVADRAPGDLEWRAGTDELGDHRLSAATFACANAPIAIYTVSTGETRTVGDVQANELTWSPDGATIAYTQAVLETRRT